MQEKNKEETRVRESWISQLSLIWSIYDVIVVWWVVDGTCRQFSIFKSFACKNGMLTVMLHFKHTHTLDTYWLYLRFDALLIVVVLITRDFIWKWFIENVQYAKNYLSMSSMHIHMLGEHFELWLQVPSEKLWAIWSEIELIK